VGVERRQVFDLPPVTVQVIEHQLIARRCSCGTTTCGTAPEGVVAPVRYGPRITAIILYLYVGGVPVEETHRAGVGRVVSPPRSPKEPSRA
jgi:zinc-finger binding domain of transposase IS66